MSGVLHVGWCLHIMQRMRFKVGLLLCTLLSLPQAIASSDDAARGKELIQQAVDKTNIFALPSFRMNANVRLENFGKPLNGTYSLLWNGPEQWREEITFPGYSEVQIGGKGIIYVKRSTTYMPYQIHKLRSAFPIRGAGIVPRPDETIKKIHAQKIGDSRADCVEIASEQKSTREVCVDTSTGTITRQKLGFIETDFAPVGSKTFPRIMALIEKGKHIVDVQITELSKDVMLSTGVFGPPQGAISRQGCIDPVPGRLKHKVEPQYPVEDKIAGNQGTVGIFAVIDKSGVPQNLEITLGASPGLNRTSMDAVRQWRYDPPTCGGEPTEVETTIEVNYQIQP